jgi:hypothetical protein
MAPGFWRVRRRSTPRFIRWRAERWPQAFGASCTEAWNISRSVSPMAL